MARAKLYSMRDKIETGKVYVTSDEYRKILKCMATMEGINCIYRYADEVIGEYGNVSELTPEDGQEIFERIIEECSIIYDNMMQMFTDDNRDNECFIDFLDVQLTENNKEEYSQLIWQYYIFDVYREVGTLQYYEFSEYLEHAYKESLDKLDKLGMRDEDCLDDLEIIR